MQLYGSQMEKGVGLAVSAYPPYPPPKIKQSRVPLRHVESVINLLTNTTGGGGGGRLTGKKYWHQTYFTPIANI